MNRRKIASGSVFAVGLGLLVCIVVPWILISFWWSERQGIEKTEALLRGDEGIQLESFVIDYQQRQVRCSDPEALRYLERCFRENAPTHLDDRVLYRLRLRFANGGRLDVHTDWSKGGFSLCMPGDRSLEDGGEPRAWVVFRSPIPGPVKEMIDFLNDDSGKANGTVLILEAGSIRRVPEPLLRSP